MLPWKNAFIPVTFSGHSDGANSASGDQGCASRHKSARLRAGLTTDDQKIVYAVGLSLGQSLAQLGLSHAELEIVKQALTDAAAGKPAEDLNTWGPKINAFAQARATKAAAAEKANSKAFLDKAAAEPGATRAASGLVYRELAAGTGPFAESDGQSASELPRHADQRDRVRQLLQTQYAGRISDSTR